MSGQRTEEILGRLFGSSEETPGSVSGGLLLPEVFTRILETLLGEGPVPAKILHAEIWKIFQHKSERIRDRGWSAAGDFCDDMLYILADREYITENDGMWSLTEKATPDVRLRILKIPGRLDAYVRVTFHDPRTREAREVIVEYWQSIGRLVRSFEGREDHAPALRKAQDQAREIRDFLAEVIQDPGKLITEDKVRPPSPDAEKGKRRFPGQARWYRKWAPTAGWHSMNDILPVWNQQNPGMRIENVSYFSVRNEAARLTREGRMERRETAGGKDFFEYRWIRD